MEMEVAHKIKPDNALSRLIRGGAMAGAVALATVGAIGGPGADAGAAQKTHVSPAVELTIKQLPGSNWEVIAHVNKGTPKEYVLNQSLSASAGFYTVTHALTSSTVWKDTFNMQKYGPQPGQTFYVQVGVSGTNGKMLGVAESSITGKLGTTPFESYTGKPNGTMTLSGMVKGNSKLQVWLQPYGAPTAASGGMPVAEQPILFATKAGKKGESKISVKFTPTAAILSNYSVGFFVAAPGYGTKSPTENLGLKTTAASAISSGATSVTSGNASSSSSTQPGATTTTTVAPKQAPVLSVAGSSQVALGQAINVNVTGGTPNAMVVVDFQNGQAYPQLCNPQQLDGNGSASISLTSLSQLYGYLQNTGGSATLVVRYSATGAALNPVTSNAVTVTLSQ